MRAPLPPAALGALLLVLLPGLSACEESEPHAESPPAGDSVLVLRDQAGQQVELDRPPERIVSLVPSATGILRELGATERLVARTDFDTAAVLEDLPSVGQGLRPSLERLVALDPDLVIRFEGEQDRDTPAALDRAGIPHLGVRPDRVEDVLEMIRILGTVVERTARADSLRRGIARELDAVRRRVEGRPRPRVAFLLGGDPPWVVTQGTFLHELLEVAGGRNVLANAGRLYAPVAVEEIVRHDLDLILVLESGSLPEQLASRPVRRLPDGVQSPGVHLGRSARQISQVLHPELWP